MRHLAALASLLLLLPAAGAHAAAPLSGVTQVSAGERHSCAVTFTGALRCWGENFSGQLGTGTRESRGSPVDVLGLSSGVAMVAAGKTHTCAVTAAGAAKCWGSNLNGQLGDGTQADRLSPVTVSGLSSGVLAITVGEGFSCALTTGGGVKCWGFNGDGALGNNGFQPSLVPVDVIGLPAGVAAISAGDTHVCALLVGGALRCWGRNDAGQVGDGTTSQRSLPTDVLALPAGASAVSAGSRHTCAVATGGPVKCWGANAKGQLGDASVATHVVPADVAGPLTGASIVAAGVEHTCAVVAGAVRCWGANAMGQVGDSTFTDRLVPVVATGLASGATGVSAGARHACAVVGGVVKCWGDNTYGQLGAGSTGSVSTVPVEPVGLSSGIAAVKPGDEFTCALTTGGGAKCWGRNDAGQVGDGTTSSPRYAPTDVSGLSGGVASIAAGGGFACAVTTGGAARCWGANGAGTLGDGTNAARAVPGDVTGLSSGASAVAAGQNHACALTTGGGVKCWGAGTATGDGTGLPRTTPVDVAGLVSGASALASGGGHACALVAGGLKCWGGNASGQLGNGAAGAPALAPVDVAGLASGVLAVAAGANHSCALTTGGGVKCWGNNASGQVGDGAPPASRLSPVDVAGLASGVAALALGNAHSCALTTGGGVKCWGANDAGQLGDGTTQARFTPQDVPGLASGVLALGANGNHTCAVIAGGAVRCWGRNANAQLGNGASDRRPFAADVMQPDTVPDDFFFTTQAGVPLSTPRTSNAVAPAGLEGVASVSVANGEYAIGCGGAFTAAPGYLAPGQSVCVRHVSSASRGASVVTTLTVGGISGTFTSTTSARASGVVVTGPAQSNAGQVASFTATVSGASPTGAVAFKDGANVIAGCGAVALASGAATCNASGLAPGAHAITAEYAGDANHDPSVSAALAHEVVSPVRLVNVSTRMAVLTGENVLIGGFIVQGATPKTLVVRARGPSLTPFGITNALANPRLDLYAGPTVIASNDDWGTAANAPDLVASGLAPGNAREPALLVTLAPGAYTAMVTGVGGTTGVGIVEVFEVDAPTSPLANLSTRGFVQSGQNVMIAGFAISGDAPKTVILRARGPSLGALGVAGPLGNPVIQLYNGSTLLAQNDDWQSGPDAAAIQAAGFAPSNALESALRASLPPGLYTVVVSGVAGTGGVAIVEVFAQ